MYVKDIEIGASYALGSEEFECLNNDELNKLQSYACLFYFC